MFLIPALARSGPRQAETQTEKRTVKSMTDDQNYPPSSSPRSEQLQRGGRVGSNVTAVGGPGVEFDPQALHLFDYSRPFSVPRLKVVPDGGVDELEGGVEIGFVDEDGDPKHSNNNSSTSTNASSRRLQPAYSYSPYSYFRSTLSTSTPSLTRSRSRSPSPSQIRNRSRTRTPSPSHSSYNNSNYSRPVTPAEWVVIPTTSASGLGFEFRTDTGGIGYHSMATATSSKTSLVSSHSGGKRNERGYYVHDNGAVSPLSSPAFDQNIDTSKGESNPEKNIKTQIY
jgi:hypothetical protein